MAEQNLKTFEKALKENYLPVWRNQLGVEPSALLGKIKKVPLVANQITATAPLGLSGGFGFGAEGEATPTSGRVMFERFSTKAKDMYVNVEISEKAVRLATNSGAMANALDTEVKAAYETAKWNVGRSLFGDGSGKLATISAYTAKSGDTPAYVTVDSTVFLKEGLTIDVYTGNSKKATVRIVGISRGDKAVYVDGTTTLASGDAIYIQNSKDREITGLGAIFDDSIASIYGVTKNAILKPTVVDANSDISDSVITKALRTAKNDKNSKIDMILMGDDAYDNYVEYLRVNNIRVEDMSHTISGGFKAIKFLFGNQEVDIVNESFVPSTEAWGVETGCLEMHSQEWDFAELQGGGIFNLMEGKSVYRALLANYGDLICTNPGGCIRITDCA